MKKLNIFIFLLLLSPCAIAQVLLGSAGSSHSNTTTQLQWSLGESFIGGYNNNAHFISIGYQQPVKIEIVGVEDKEILEGISVYPNPFAEQIYLEIPSWIKNDYKLTLNEISGKSLDILVENEGARLRIDATKWASGVYLLKIEHQKELFVAKIIKR